jgi:hypothetical protein
MCYILDTSIDFISPFTNGEPEAKKGSLSLQEVLKSNFKLCSNLIPKAQESLFVQSCFIFRESETRAHLPMGLSVLVSSGSMSSTEIWVCLGRQVTRQAGKGMSDTEREMQDTGGTQSR